MQQHHQGSNSVGMLRRSRTLHYRPPTQEYRRRASHPASPSYCAATMHHCVTPCSVLSPARGLLEEGELVAAVRASHSAGPAHSPHHHSGFLGQVRGANTHERCYDKNPSNQTVLHDWWHSQERCLIPEPMVAERDREIEREREKWQIQKVTELKREREAQIHEERDRERQQELTRSRAREQQQLQNLFHPTPMGDVNDTWPKPASRQTHGGGTGRGPYSTLEGHTGAFSIARTDAKRGHISASSSPNPSSGLRLKFDINSKPNAATRMSRIQFLKDRASQLADERSGMSTDEETNTDILMGRYWSRTERREQFLLSRVQKQQQLQARGIPVQDVISRGGATVRADGVSVGKIGMMDNRGRGVFAEGRCNMALELSQRKLNRLRNRKLLDDWTTVEELLTHGTRMDNPEDMLCPNSLLTVTTV